MLQRFTLASGSKSISATCGSAPSLPYPIYLSSGDNYPVFRRRNGSSIWSFVDIDSSHPFTDIRELFTDQTIKRAFHDNPIIVPSNCIYAHIDGKVKLIRSMTERVFLFAGVIRKIKGNEYFRVITSQSPDILSEFTDQIPVLIDPNDRMRFISNPDLEFISGCADESGSDWFDVFDVSPKVATSTVNAKSLITPTKDVDRSQVDKLEKEILDFRNRANRRSGK